MDKEFAFAFLAGCEMVTDWNKDTGALVMRTRHPIGIQELRPGEFRVCEFRDARSQIGNRKP